MLYPCQVYDGSLEHWMWDGRIHPGWDMNRVHHGIFLCRSVSQHLITLYHLCIYKLWTKTKQNCWYIQYRADFILFIYFLRPHHQLCNGWKHYTMGKQLPVGTATNILTSIIVCLFSEFRKLIICITHIFKFAVNIS